MNSSKKIKILFLAPNPEGIGASQRFRFEHYLPYLSNLNIRYQYRTFINKNDYPYIYKRGLILKKILIILKGLVNRFFLLFTIPNYDFIYIHREAAPIGPPIFEWVTSKFFNKKIIYDFDDSIWIRQASEVNPFAAPLKCSWKVTKIISWSWKVSVGNQFLKNFALAFNQNVCIIPTVVDTENVHTFQKQRVKKNRKIVGWTGTFSNFNNFSLVLPAIKRIQNEFNIQFFIIADKDPKLIELEYHYIPWNKKTEINDLRKLDIGIMPLLDGEVQRGKCGFKAIQYMAIGIPPVISPVGVNTEIVKDGENGFLAQSSDDWYIKIKILLENNEIYNSISLKARKTIEG